MKILCDAMKLIIISFLFLIVSACSSNTIKNIQVEALADCNRNMPVAMDILFIEDKELVSLLSGLSGPQWFSKKQELLIRYQQKIDLASFEIVPLSILPSLQLPENYSDAEYVLLFANYLASSGQYIAEIGSYQQLKIRLERERYRLIDMSDIEKIAYGN
jgi:hypothetical protein